MGIEITVITVHGAKYPHNLRELIWQEYYIDGKANGMTEEQAREFASKSLTPGFVNDPRPADEGTIEVKE